MRRVMFVMSSGWPPVPPAPLAAPLAAPPPSATCLIFTLINFRLIFIFISYFAQIFAAQNLRHFEMLFGIYERRR